MAVPQPGVWGIDLGQCALKAIRLEMKDGQAVATAFDYIEHPKILSQPDADPDQLTREALTQFLSRNNLRGDTVVISVPGQSGLARFVKLPPVEEKKIADIVRFEAKQQIPFPLEEVVWDFQKLSSGAIGGDFVETEIGLFAMKRDMVNRALGQFKDVNVEVHVIQMTPLALCNYVAYDLLGKGGETTSAGDDEAPAASKNCVVALDIGTDNSSLVITDGGKIIWQRPIPLGGNHFTRALTKDLKLTFAKAEHLKRNAAKSPDLKKILAALKSVLNDFVGEVQRSLGYFTNTHRDAQVQYMIGLGNAFRLPGLQKFLQEKLGLEVRKMQKLQRTSGDAVTAAPNFQENILSFAVAYGLALQGLKQTRLQTNLLPQEVRLERIVRGKKPWAVAAAACLLLAVAGLAFAKGIELGRVDTTDPGLKKAMAGIKSQVDTYTGNVSKYDSEVRKINESIDNLKKIGAGIDDRFNWQRLTEYVNMALPMPNGERVTESSHRNEAVKEKYFTKAAKRAFDLLEARRFAKPGTEIPAEQAKKEDELIRKNLIQLNVVGLTSLYSEDLSAYFKKIHEAGDQLRGMPAEEKAKVVQFVAEKDADARSKLEMPKAGWIVEVRGYTYHFDKDMFVENTLIENLKYPERLKNPDGSPVKLSKQMDDEVRKQIGYLLIYKVETDAKPAPGQFKLVNRSYLNELIGSTGNNTTGGTPGVTSPPMTPGGPGVPMTPPSVPGGGGDSSSSTSSTEEGKDGEKKVDRSGWQPLSGVTTAATSATSGSVIATPRTEFVVLFIWKEPLGRRQAPQTAAPTDTPPTTPPAEEKKS